MTDEVLAVGRWASNASMIADVARLGYLDGHVLDATAGDALGFWKEWRPELLTTNDLNALDVDCHDDYRNFTWDHDTFDAVVFDPPYRMGGRLDRPDDARYGVTEHMSRAARLGDIVAGAVECYRVSRRYLLVKCMDAVEGGQVRWQTDLITEAIGEQGGRKVDRFDFVKPSRPQPPGRAQRRARRNVSTLLIFEKPKGR